MGTTAPSAISTYESMMFWPCGAQRRMPGARSSGGMEVRSTKGMGSLPVNPGSHAGGDPHGWPTLAESRTGALPWESPVERDEVFTPRTVDSDADAPVRLSARG